jgi:hypothetical protein
MSDFHQNMGKEKTYFGCGRNLERGKSFAGSMKNLSPCEYDVATMPSIILIENNCILNRKIMSCFKI